MAPLLSDEEKAIDPYTLLGVEVTATDKVVQKAYRKLSLKCHPDKNPGADAAAMFHQITLALNMLLDPAKRKFLDTKLEQSRAQAARYAEMQGKRKAGVDDLLRREEEANKRRRDAALARQAAADEEAVREAGRRLVEERQRAMYAAAAARAAPPEPAPAPAPAPSSSNTPPPISEIDLTLRLQLPPDSSFASASELEGTIKAKYGPVSHVLLRDDKKPGKKSKGARAVVEFAPGNWGGCWACYVDNTGGRALEPGVKAKWAAGAEPAWVAWAASHGTPAPPKPAPAPVSAGPPSFSAPSFSSAPSFGSAPDFMGAGGLDSALGRHETERKAREAAKEAERTASDAFASATLLRMRQLERQMLAEKIRLEEEGEE